MTAAQDKMSAVSQFLHQHLLKLIILSYGLAAVFPGPGLWLNGANVLDLAGLPGRVAITPPKLLLWLLLLCRRPAGADRRIGQPRPPGDDVAGPGGKPDCPTGVPGP